MIIGFVVTWTLVIFVFPILIPAEAGKGLDDYGLGYTILTAFPIGMIFVTWLDYFLDTKIYSE